MRILTKFIQKIKKDSEMENSKYLIYILEEYILLGFVSDYVEIVKMLTEKYWQHVQSSFEGDEEVIELKVSINNTFTTVYLLMHTQMSVDYQILIPFIQTVLQDVLLLCQVPANVMNAF